MQFCGCNFSQFVFLFILNDMDKIILFMGSACRLPSTWPTILNWYLPSFSDKENHFAVFVVNVENEAECKLSLFSGLWVDHSRCRTFLLPFPQLNLSLRVIRNYWIAPDCKKSVEKSRWLSFSIRFADPQEKTNFLQHLFLSPLNHQQIPCHSCCRQLRIKIFSRVESFALCHHLSHKLWYNFNWHSADITWHLAMEIIIKCWLCWKVVWRIRYNPITSPSHSMSIKMGR